MTQLMAHAAHPDHPAVAGRTQRNPVFAGYFADPFVFRHEGVYYAIGTGPPSAAGYEFPMLRSRDFWYWEEIDHALVRPKVEGDCFWAPEIAFRDGVFYMYYSVGHADRGHHLRVATSKRPQGPYTDTGAPLLDPKSCPFAIDASPFLDDDGRWYLFYARDFLDSQNGMQAGTALAVAPLDDMVRIPDAYKVVMRARHAWQLFQAHRRMYGQIFDWHTLEGPCTVKHQGRYYCLYSGGNWQNDTYGVDFVVSEHPLGPYVDTNSGHGPRVLQTLPGKVIGPGHNSVVAGPDGRTQYVAYHAWGTDMKARRMFFDRLVWLEDGPRCEGPTWEPEVVEP